MWPCATVSLRLIWTAEKSDRSQIRESKLKDSGKVRNKSTNTIRGTHNRKKKPINNRKMPETARTKLRFETRASMVASALLVFLSAFSPASSATTHNSEDGDFGWRVWNYTDKPLTQGIFNKFQGNATSGLSFSQLYPGQHAGAYLYGPSGYANYTSGMLCYDNTKWELPEQDTSTDAWSDVFIFAGEAKPGIIQLMATPQGGYDDRGMVYHGQC